MPGHFFQQQSILSWLVLNHLWFVSCSFILHILILNLPCLILLATSVLVCVVWSTFFSFIKMFEKLIEIWTSDHFLTTYHMGKTDVDSFCWHLYFLTFWICNFTELNAVLNVVYNHWFILSFLIYSLFYIKCLEFASIFIIIIFVMYCTSTTLQLLTKFIFWHKIHYLM